MANFEKTSQLSKQAHDQPTEITEVQHDDTNQQSRVVRGGKLGECIW